MSMIGGTFGRSDWRNRSAHGIPQHFEFGQTELVSRWVEFERELVHLPCGGVEFKEDRSRKAVSYVFGGFEALNLDQILLVNRVQFELAGRAMQACEELLKEIGACARADTVSGDCSASPPSSC